MKKKTNFYFRTESGNEIVEVYVGQSSGKQLSEDILNAKEEVLIISPYIDESKLDDLINLKNKNINVRLAFSSLREKDKQDEKILKKLIHQHKETDNYKKEQKEKLKNKFFLYSIISICAGTVFFLYGLLQMKIEAKSIICIVAAFVLFYAYHQFTIKKDTANRIPIYRYNYSKKINFKYLRNFKDSKMFMHSKIYVIDRKIAYMGSLNFTNNGFTSNFETRIRITQKNKIEELVEFMHSIFEDDINFKSHEIGYLGKKAYTEEKY